MGNAYLKQAPAGVPGDVTRPDETNVEPAMLVAVGGVYAQRFGIPMKYVTGGIQQFNGGAETSASFAGILGRVAPSISGNTNAGYDDTTPWAEQVQSLIVRGYINVKCTVGTPVRGGVVYVRIVADTGKAVGDFEATSDGSNSIALTTTQATWASDGKDADNNCEIRVAR